jgi:hypothetical protein
MSESNRYTLIEQRKERIALMERTSYVSTIQKLQANQVYPYTEKETFLADYESKTGVRDVVAKEYFRILLKSGALEEDENDSKFFRNTRAVKDFEAKKAQPKTIEVKP